MKRQHFLRSGVIVFVLFLALYSSGAVAGQDNMPDRIQIYRFIRSTSHARAGDIRWIEIWESRDDSQHAKQAVMVDGKGGPQGVDVSCYYAMAIGSGMPIYMVDGQRIPVDTAEQLWDMFENKRLVAQSELFATDADCQNEGSETVNGIQAQYCSFDNVDASTLFLIRPPATSHGELWTATDGGFPVRYEFEANGSDADVFHHFEAMIPPDDFVIKPPEDVELLCFDDGFPIPEATVPLTQGNLTYAAFQSDKTSEELERFYDRELLPTWVSEGSDNNGARSYSRTLDNGNECQLYLRFSPRTDGYSGTLMTISAYPSFVNAANLPSPEGFESPVVVQSFNDATITVDGDLKTVLANYTADLEAEGWTLRDELTDIREISAFVTFARDNYELYIIIDSKDGKTSLRIRTQGSTCGPIFSGK